MIKLYQYFGIIGIASIVAWVAALCMLVIYIRHTRRHVHYFRALAIAVLACVLARINSDRVSAIETDRTDQLEAARLQQQRIRDESEGAGKVRVRFAEDSSRDRLDLAGITRDEAKALIGDSGSEPAYRQKGKQSREADKRQPVVGVGELGEDVAVKEKPPRVMKEEDVLRANRLDRYNLLFVHMVLWMSGLAFIGDYLWRFNRTFLWYFPLPISGSWVDHLFHKSRAVLLLNQKTQLWKEFLEGVVRKGETFIYFGENDLWQSPRLPRLVVGRKGVFPLHRIVYGAPEVPHDDEFFFDSAWFKHYCIVVRNPDDALRLVRGLITYLDRRHVTRAAARQTVNLVWDLATLPDLEDTRKLISLAKETNFKFILSAPGQVPEALVQCFDEVHPEGVARLVQTSRTVGDFAQEREAKRQARSARKAEKEKAAEEKRRQKKELLAKKQAEEQVLRENKQAEEQALKEKKQAEAHALKEKEQHESVDAEKAAAEKRKKEWGARARKMGPAKGLKQPGLGTGPRLGGGRLPQRTMAPAGDESGKQMPGGVEKPPVAQKQVATEDTARKEPEERAIREAVEREAMATPEHETRERREREALKDTESAALADAEKAAALEKEKQAEEQSRREAEAKAERARVEREMLEKAEREAREQAEREAKERSERERLATEASAREQETVAGQTTAPESATVASGNFTFQCSKCGGVLSAELGWVGMEVACPLCATMLIVPVPGAERPTEPVAPRPGPEVSTFTFACPKCQQPLTAQPEWRGMEVKCPLCGQAMTVPAAPAAV